VSLSFTFSDTGLFLEMEMAYGEESLLYGRSHMSLKKGSIDASYMKRNYPGALTTTDWG